MTEPRLLAVVRDYEGFHAALRARVEELGVSREAIDYVTGLQSGYASKLLAPVPIKALGMQSFGPMMRALGLTVHIYEDLEDMEKITSRMAKKLNASIAMLPMRRRKGRRYPKLGTEWGALMNARRSLVLSVSKRKQIARKAARARWKKLRLVELDPKTLKPKRGS